MSSGMWEAVLVCALVCSLCGAPAQALTVTTQETGEIVFVEGAEPVASVACGAFGPDWQWTSQLEAREIASPVAGPDRREVAGSIDIPNTTAAVTFRETVSCTDEGGLRAEYEFRAIEPGPVNSLWVSAYLPCDRYAEARVTAYDERGKVLHSAPLPGTLEKAQLFSSGEVSRVAVEGQDGPGLELRFPSVAQVLLQDNRQWGGADFELRIETLGEYAGRELSPGLEFSSAMAILLSEPADFQLDPAQAVSRTDTSGWAPFTLPWDEAPLDLSWLNDKPAGVHGFVGIRDGRLVFEDGTPARFWGVCVSAAGNFPTHEQSERIAERMAKFGLNMVRTHHADAGWSDPNFFDESYGDTQHFDAEALDRFDYFLYCLKQQGIYVYLDQLVHRKFTEGDGVANADELDYAAKPYTLFDPRLVELQQQFSRNLWAHVNPYTGLACRDDPAIALMDFTNENDLFTFSVEVEPYATRLEEMWREWARAHAVDPEQPIRNSETRSSDVRRFIDEVQKRYYREMHGFLRDLGVRVPITGNTWLAVAANLPSQATMDFVDSHAYWDHPVEWKRFHNRAEVRVDPRQQGSNAATLAASLVQGKPFVCSEWGHPWHNEWRAEGPLSAAAIAALQGWDGALAYTYRHSTEVPVGHITGFFDTFNDPCVFGLMPAAALLYRRGDVAPAASQTAVKWDEPDLFGERVPMWGATSAYRTLVERTGVVTVLPGQEAAGATVGPHDVVPTVGPTWTRSDTGELSRDWQAAVATIDTPRTQAAYGFLGTRGEIGLSDITVNVRNRFGVVAVSALDGRPIRESAHLLVTAVARAENTDMVYNLTRTELREDGRTPILVEPLEGEVRLRLGQTECSVRAVGADGTRQPVAVERVDDALVLPLDSAPAIYYEIRVSP